MKKYIIILIFLFCYQVSYCQNDIKAKSLIPIKYGVKIGGNIANVTSIANEGVSNIDKTPIFGLSGGFYMQIALNDKWFINPEILYVQKGISAKSEYIHRYEPNQQDLHRVSHELALAYIELNPIISFKANDKFSLNAGPSISMQLSSEYTSNDIGEHDGLSTHEELDEWIFEGETLDIGINIGLSYYINNNFILESKINNGFMKSGVISKEISTAGTANNEIKSNIFELKNNGVLFSFIYLF